MVGTLGLDGTIGAEMLGEEMPGAGITGVGIVAFVLRFTILLTLGTDGMLGTTHILTLALVLSRIIT